MAYRLRLDWLSQSPLVGTDLNVPFRGPVFMILEGTTQAPKEGANQSHTQLRHLHTIPTQQGTVTLRKQQRHETVAVTNNCLIQFKTIQHGKMPANSSVLVSSVMEEALQSLLNQHDH